MHSEIKAEMPYRGRDDATKRIVLAKPIGASAYGFVSRLLSAGGYVSVDAE